MLVEIQTVDGSRGRVWLKRERGAAYGALRKILVPLALAQFICSFAGSNMNVMITDISKDLDTTVQGVQVAITVFLLVMAALMIPGGKLTDRWGRKRCFTAGLIIYGIGALMSAASPGLGVLILGNSIFEGVGTALLIPPVYILTTLLFTNVTSRARAFGVITGMGGIGAAAGPLIGGLITTAISWRAAFVFQAMVIAVIVFLSRRIVDPVAPDPTRPFDTLGAVLSAAGLVLVVMGVLAADNNLVLMAVLMAVGVSCSSCSSCTSALWNADGEEPLLSTEPLPKPNVEPRARHAERAVGAPHRNRVRRVGVPPGRSRLQRHPNRRDLHRRERRHLGVVTRRRTTRQEVRATNTDHGRLHHHHRRDRRPARTREGLAERLGVRPRTAAPRPRRRRHADPIRQRRAIRVQRGTTRRDLRPVALHLQSRLFPRHGRRRHDPRLQPSQDVVRRGHDLLALIGGVGLGAALSCPPNGLGARFNV